MPPIADDHPLRRALPLFLLAGFCLASLDATAKYLVRDHSLFLVVWARYITFLAPIFIVILSKPMLGERPTRARWTAAIVGFAGILIMLRPGSAVFHPAVLLLIGAALTNGLYQILTRKLVGEDPRTMLFYSALVGTVAMTLALPWGFTGAALTPHTGVLFLLLGLLAGLGHWSVIGAFLRAPASMLTPYTYLQIVWGTAYGFLVFDHVPDGWSGVGMAVIVGSGLALALHERRWGRRG